jgi:hypothetical protein
VSGRGRRGGRRRTHSISIPPVSVVVVVVVVLGYLRRYAHRCAKQVCARHDGFEGECWLHVGGGLAECRGRAMMGWSLGGFSSVIISLGFHCGDREKKQGFCRLFGILIITFSLLLSSNFVLIY